MPPSTIWQLLFLGVAACFAIYVITSPQSLVTNSLSNSLRLSDEYFATARSAKTPYSNIETDLYKPLGFETVKIAKPFPILRHVESLNCRKVFDDWLFIANTYDAKQTPPKDIPASLYPNYTMGGFAYLIYYYFNEKSTSNPVHWKASDINARIAAKNFHFKYGDEGAGVDSALKSFSIAGKTGLVIGSLQPWAEALCLKHRAAKVLTVEYQKITTDHPQMGYIHPIEMVKKWKSHQNAYDFVVSFSSIEHSGLGRFGDPLDPIGDIREMQKVLCVLKKGGLMFLGVPVGADGVAFNAHRFYGRIRLPMMFAGFELLATFVGRSEQPTILPQIYLDMRNAYQHVFVLRKL